MPSPSLPQSLRSRLWRVHVALSIATLLLAGPGSAQEGRAPEKEKPKAAANKTPDKPVADKTPDNETTRFCANAVPSIAEARIAWETKKLNDIDSQVKQRLADLEKGKASLQEWVSKRDAMLKSASDNLVAIYSKMDPATAATQIAGMDDQMAAAILGKLKPAAAGAILNEMEADRASKLAVVLSGLTSTAKKS